MNGNNWIFYIPIFISLLLTCVIGIYAWRYRQSPGIRSFFFITLAEISWMSGYIFEISSPGLGEKVFWDNFQFIGSLFAPLMHLIFAFEYTGRQKFLSRRIRNGLFLFPILFLALLLTDPWHGLVRQGPAWIVANKPFDTLLYDFTLPMWISFIYGYVTHLAAMILFMRNLTRQRRLFRTQNILLVVGFMIPFLGSIPSMMNIVILGQRDITPYTFGVANLIFAFGLFRFNLFEIAPIARDAVLEHMSDVVLVVDTQFRVVDINPAALLTLNLSARQAIGSPLSRFLGNQPDLMDMIQQEAPARRDVTYSAGDGQTCILDAFASSLKDMNGRPIGRLLVARDITDKRKMEMELQKAYDELELRVRLRTAELEAKNSELERFTYTASHDLKSPLVTISGFLGFLEKSAAAGNIGQMQSDIHRIQDAVKKMQRLLNELLELSRIGRLMNPPQMTSLEEIASDAVRIVHGQLEARKIAVHIQPGLPAVYGDRQRLTEVLQNLIDNAAKYMGNQPIPVIEIGTCSGDADEAVFFVRDNGIGIAAEYHERIFGLFDKLDANSEGTGIGLALVKRIVEFHGGRIWVESDTGQGTTFFFTLAGSDKESLAGHESES